MHKPAFKAWPTRIIGFVARARVRVTSPSAGSHVVYTLGDGTQPEPSCTMAIGGAWRATSSATDHRRTPLNVGYFRASCAKGPRSSLLK